MRFWLILSAVAMPVCAQVVLPATGKKFDSRTISGSGGVSVGAVTRPPAPTKTRLTSYFMLGDSRQWKSTDGKSLLGAIIIFEDAVIEFDAANPAAAKEAAGKAPPPKMPEKPTLIREGKIRLLVNQKPLEVPLTRLSAEDRKYVDDLNARLPK
ncbi:hypothetical protein [Prosthecobacter fluviatilis]|uniref:Uncharacterized protein n=1 Tax=Prosthecobacter fluviatilis TaxID=445931 RepID=A0ABW0KS14_9BACT